MVVGHGRVAPKQGLHVGERWFIVPAAPGRLSHFLAATLGEGQNASKWKPGTQSLLTQRQLILLAGRGEQSPSL